MIFGNIDLLDIIFTGIIFVISISLHEYAHARASDKLGDPTPKTQGRLTPNPLAHIDPIGFLLIFVINFGRGRPVMVQPSYYKNPLRDELLVALAGPATNIALAVASILILSVYAKIVGVDQLIGSQDLIMQFRMMFGWMNCGLAVFNMIPIPPLDGYRIISYIFPQTKVYLETYRMYFGILLLGLIFLPGISGYLGGFIRTVSNILFSLIQLAVSSLFFR